MMRQVRSTILLFVTVLQCFFILLRNSTKAWTFLNFAPLGERVNIFVQSIFQLTLLYSKLLVSGVAHAWRTPIASQTRRECERLLDDHNDAIKKSTLTQGQEAAFDIQMARVVLNAVFDRATVQHISTFAPHMGLFHLHEGKHVFKQSLEPQDVIPLMNQRVPAVCVSYKHTRRSSEGLPKDVARVRKAIAQAASRLSQERLLFWCDIIGHTPRGVSWAEQGIDPYLCMPTMRIVSAELREEIDDSFWMTIERIAGAWRGGMFSYDEGETRLRFGPPEDGYFASLPDYSFSFKAAKLGLAKMICNPILYYRRARCENDKLEVMKYAVSCTISGRMNWYGIQQNEERLLRIVSERDFVRLFQVISIEKIFDQSETLDLHRPTAERIMGDEERWRGAEESLPALKVFQSQDRELVNTTLRKGAFWICPISPAADNNVTDVICMLFGNLWCGALRLRIANFQEHEDRVTGRVLSFRVATKDEEESLILDESIRKEVCFT